MELSKLSGTRRKQFFKVKNSLYVQCYEQINKAFDRKEKEYLLAEGMSSSVRWKLNAYNAGGAYYVIMKSI